MPELALHILDLVQNSISAGATLIVVSIVYDTASDSLVITIDDDGCGMSPEMLEKVENPFTTSRTTRKVGLGIPMIKQLSEMCEGSFELDSTLNEGTRLSAAFKATHVDLPPMGDIIGTIASLLIACPEAPDFKFIFKRDDKEFEFDTQALREPLGFMPLNEPDILEWVQEYLREGLAEI